MDPDLYADLQEVARRKGTTISAQLENAIREYVQRSLVGRVMPFLQPHLQALINAEVRAIVGEQVAAVKDRLAGLLAKVALDTASVLYFVGNPQRDGYRMEHARAWAAGHGGKRVQGALDQEKATEQEVEALRARLAEMKPALALARAQAQKAEQDAAARLQQTVAGLQAELARERAAREKYEQILRDHEAGAYAPELDRARREIERLQSELAQATEETRRAERQRQATEQQLAEAKADLAFQRELHAWERDRDAWAGKQWANQGLLQKRRNFHEFQAEYQQTRPAPVRGV